MYNSSSGAKSPELLFLSFVKPIPFFVVFMGESSYTKEVQYGG